MRLPAEWERQDGVQLTWPHCDTEWYELEKVLGCYVEIAYNILRFEKLIIATRDIEECKSDISRISAQKGLIHGLFDCFHQFIIGFKSGQFRIVRFQLDNGNYECLATNLSRGNFPPEKLKALYARRWGIELSYRDLKYTLGMNNMHSRKTNSIKQEIYSNLIMHNFCRINSAFAEVKKK